MAKDPALTFVTGECRLSFPNLFEPRKGDGEGDKKKYSALLLIPKTDTKTIAAIKKAQYLALVEAVGASKAGSETAPKFPPGWKNTLRDGDEEKDLEETPEYTGMYFMNVSANEAYPPGVVIKNGSAIEPVLDKSDIYPGCWIRAQINAFAFDVDKSKGVSFGLRHVMKVRDDEPLSEGFASAEDVFSAFVDDEDSVI